MGVPISIEKTDETSAHCVYTFGPPDAPVGRARLDKASGDVELLALDESSDGPSEQFYLAHLVPRLQRYHDQGTYPPAEQWTA
jgi:hypothetical protein